MAIHQFLIGIAAERFEPDCNREGLETGCQHILTHALRGTSFNAGAALLQEEDEIGYTFLVSFHTSETWNEIRDVFEASTMINSVETANIL